ncbi:MAG: maleylpyruvate isomerase family mycothiol-dependent enzyme [Dehalococcoidia bacterium]
MKPPQITVSHLFPELLSELLHILSELSPEEWQKPTGCPGWSVKDVAAHLLGVEAGILSGERDEFGEAWIVTDSWDELVALLNQHNEAWVLATRRISPALLCDLLKSLGEQTCRYYASVNPEATGPVVDWAGPEPAPMWLHLAREYTERWHHQQQIREALGQTLLTQPHFFAPVLATFVFGMPRAYSDITAPVGTTVELSILGDSGGEWHLVRGEDSWRLSTVDTAATAAQLMIDQYDAWKLFTRSVPKSQVVPRVQVRGDTELALRALETVSVIA